MTARRGRRRGVALIDCALATVVLALLALGLLSLQRSTGQGSRVERDRLVVRGLAERVLARQVAGAARELLLTEPDAEGVRRRELDPSEWELLVTGSEAAMLTARDARVELALRVEDPSSVESRYPLGEVRCRVTWCPVPARQVELEVASLVECW